MRVCKKPSPDRTKLLTPSSKDCWEAPRRNGRFSLSTTSFACSRSSTWAGSSWAEHSLLPKFAQTDWDCPNKQLSLLRVFAFFRRQKQFSPKFTYRCVSIFRHIFAAGNKRPLNVATPEAAFSMLKGRLCFSCIWMRMYLIFEHPRSSFSRHCEVCFRFYNIERAFFSSVNDVSKY